MDNNRKYRGVSGSTILMFIVIVVVALWMASRMQIHRQEMTYTDFVSEVEAENVTDVYIDQNRAVPYGYGVLHAEGRGREQNGQCLQCGGC